jgi:hypothetical protein
MSMRILVACVLLISAASIAYGEPPANGCTKHDTFPAACNPFGSSAGSPAIDGVCGVTGDASDPGDLAQDKVKNNLCATGTPHELTLGKLADLQKDVDESGLVYGNRHVHTELPPLTADRASFFEKEHAAGFGEGDPVVFVGFIVDTKKGDPETVNCHCTPAAFNDIHVTLADHPIYPRKAPAGATKAERDQIRRSNNSKLCQNAFTAEAIPHLRPAALERASLNTLKNTKVVRVSGQLFFDASHHACKNNQPGSGDPARISSWEIHPIYDVKVCKKSTVSDCSADDASLWNALQP